MAGFWTQADIEKVKTAIADCVLEVEFDGPPKRKLKRHSMGEMRELLAEMRREVGAATPYRHTKHKRGFRG